MNRTALGATVLALCAAMLGCSAPQFLSAPQPEIDESISAEAPTDESEPVQLLDATLPGNRQDVLKLVFIHHSSGENWLADDNGGLGLALAQAGFFVSDTNYDWGPTDADLGGPIGSFTDTGHWWNWFLGPNRDRVLQAVFSESEQHASYSRRDSDPGGENLIIVFKSCFPNSALDGQPGDPPTDGANPLRGLDAGSGNQTVANAKAIYRDLLEYFRSHPDKLFLAVTAPPLHKDETSAGQAANARAFNRWLVDEWLADYPLDNVAVFDFYNVLTSNGGSPDENDVAAQSGNHHRLTAGVVEYVTDQGRDTSAYAYSGDSHPTAAGNQKATAEFLPLLEFYVERWRAR